MSDKYNQMKNIKNKCGNKDLLTEMKSNGNLVCGCEGDNRFEYDPNIFDCRLFGLFLRKAENSHNKYKGLLSELNIIETAIFENKETGDDAVIEGKLNNIFDKYADINLSNDLRTFIVKYITDKTKKREDFNRYQVMSTLQSTMNFILYLHQMVKI